MSFFSIKKSVILITLFITSSTKINYSNNYSQGLIDSVKITRKLDSASFYSKEARKAYLDGNLLEANKYLELSLKIKQEVLSKNDDKIANTYNNLGIILRAAGKYKQALNQYSNAEIIYSKNNSQNDLADLYVNIANILLLNGDYIRSELNYNYALNIFETDSLKNHNKLSMIYSNLALLYKKKNKYNKALNLYLKSIRIQTDIHPITIANRYSNIGEVYHKLSKHNIADSCHKLALKIISESQQENTIWEADLIHNYGIFKTNIGNNSINLFEKSLEIYKKKLPAKHIYISIIYENLGTAYAKNNNLKVALFYFQQAILSCSNTFNDTSILQNPRIEDVISMPNLLPALKSKAKTLNKLARLSDNKKLKLASYKTYLMALEVTKIIRQGYIDQDNKLFLSENEYDIYKNALEVSIDLYNMTDSVHYLHQAFSISEASKAAILKESINNNEAIKFSGLSDNLEVQEKEVKKNIWIYEELIYEENKKSSPNKKMLAFYNKELFNLNSLYDSILTIIKDEYPEYHNLLYKNESVSIPAIQSSLKRNELVLEYSLTNNFIYSFCISRDSVILHKENIDSTFISATKKIQKSLSKVDLSAHNMKDFNSFKNTSNKLYKKLIKPFENKIHNKNLIIIPDDVLSYIPFGVLIRNNPSYNVINYKDLPYLLKYNTISYNYSSTLHFNNKKYRKLASKSVAAFAPSYNGNGTYSGLNTRQQYREKLHPIYGIIEEAEMVTSVLRGDSYLNEEATEYNFKQNASEYDVLHLAMHTLIDDTDPMYSKLAFTADTSNGEDGFLNTFELYNLTLKSRMAVLSSCNTGGGAMRKGEGVMSLARGFLYAGCPSIIMTLWNVEDKSGVELMANFYKHLINGKNKDLALRKSKLEFLEKADMLHSHPYFWSCYVTIGNKSNLYTNKYLQFAFGLIALSLLFIFMRYKYNKRNLPYCN